MVLRSEAKNRNIEKQRRFYSTKKKQKERKVRLAKPSIDEKSNMFMFWLDSLGGKETTTIDTYQDKKPKEKLQKCTLHFVVNR